MESNEEENFFSNQPRSSLFQEFASDEPLQHSEVQSNLTSATTQLDEEFNQTSPWTYVEKPIETPKSSGIGDNEPWELEDHGEEKITPIPATIRLASTFNENENSQKNYFSDSFNPVEQTEHISGKTVRFDDNVQKIRASTPPSDENLRSSLTMELDVNEITPQFNTMETDLTVCRHLKRSKKCEFISFRLNVLLHRLKQSKIQIRLNSVIEQCSIVFVFCYIYFLDTFKDHIPLPTVFPPAMNSETENRINTRSSQIEITTTNAQLVQPNESGIVIFSCTRHWRSLSLSILRWWLFDWIIRCYFLILSIVRCV